MTNGYDYAILEQDDRGIQLFDFESQPMSQDGIITAIELESDVPEGDYTVYLCNADNAGEFVIVDVQSAGEILLMYLSDFKTMFTDDLRYEYPELAKLLKNVSSNTEYSKAFETINDNPELYFHAKEDKIIGIVNLEDTVNIYLEN